ncbi:hypothetical protein PHLCEN_2v1986 [Hermanssonia centrifuga]|uniref:DUF6589 domain-containing protein n=1 Tax=Hermanssonia centrifuga TaxID=98765 RepID=A0A2R6RVD6_9APHY|nr:hypothetical protein PHLCEN_2v1986 [Hermanssonia centrifuga]
MVFKIAEQILGRTDSQENGTCATVFPLFEALDEDMKTEDLLEEEIFLRTCLIHTIIRIVVKFGGPAFAHFDQDVAASTPITSKQIPIHKTERYPLPAINIDESSRIGNAEVIDTIFKELGYTTVNKKSHGKVKIVHGDQLSVSRIGSVNPDSAVILKNWLVNPSGHANGFLPVDLLQEHMNFWVKVIYQAQGSSASWDWLETVSPCINVLRALAMQMNGDFMLG